MFNIEEELKKLPKTPGVYIHKDSLGEVIYVGKAINLRNRVRQYFRSNAEKDPKVRAMVSNIAEFEYISCATEMEALILECNLIKKYLPKYNILLKDDKSYPYIVITSTEKYPRVFKTRRHIKDGNKYYGPYSDSAAVDLIQNMLEERYPLKRCRRTEFKAGTRPCLNYFIGKCGGVCVGKVDRDEYIKIIDEINDILSGHDAGILSRLEEKMYAESELMHYEEAAKYRDYIKSLKQLSETQRASMVRDRDIDMLVPLITTRNSIVVKYKVRDGKLIGREPSFMREAEGSDGNELLTEYIKQYYSESTNLPREILLSTNIDDEELLEQFLNRINSDNAEAGNSAMHKTRLVVPERGEKRALMQMALADSIELAKSIDERAEHEEERRRELRARLEGLIVKCCELNSSEPMLISEDEDREYRVEAYDISNMNGLDTVAGMVVYEGRSPVRKDYRKFKVRTAEGDDYGSLQEVVYRRLKRAVAGDEGFSRYPDIMFIDGGIGQVHAVLKVMDAFGLTIPVVGLAKDDAHRTRAVVFSDGSEIELKGDRLLHSYCGTVQEEVHRYAISFMKGTKGRRVIKSVLEDIPGVGPKRRAELLKKFGSIENIKNASYDELLSVDGITSKVAEEIMGYLKK